ncbi:Variant-specific surface protein, partial [Giardia duodenalis]
VCREARDGACVRHAEEHSVDGRRHGSQGSRAHDSREEAKRVRGAQCTNCEASSCNVLIREGTYCSMCSTDVTGYAPIDGVCADVSSDTALCKTNAGGKCTQCDGQSFMYQGGCYQTGSQNPGNSLCTAAANGICTQAAEGYFVPPGATDAKDSAVKCDDTTGVEISGNTYKGVLNCEVCSPPTTPAGARTESVAVCTKCRNSKYLKTDGTCGEASDCTGTTFPKADNNAGNKCVLCGDETDGIADCQECSKPENALKCLTCATDTNKPNASGTKCIACATAGCAPRAAQRGLTNVLFVGL